MHVSQNVSIRWEMNFYDKNTKEGEGGEKFKEYLSDGLHFSDKGGLFWNN